MRLIIESISLRSETPTTLYGADLSLKSGFNILRAENTSGKSTCLQSIIFGLGLERYLGPKLSVPLPYAMRTKIHAAPDSAYEPVVSSWVELEISNGKGRRALIHRQIEGDLDRNLIRVRENEKSRDFFVHMEGAAVREDGFHTYMEEFIGWDLPEVVKYDGSEAKLYVETLFSLFFVEQKRGWSTVVGPFPTFFQIQDVGRRAVEYVLDLDIAKIRRKRAELRSQIDALNSDWRHIVQGIAERHTFGAKVRGIPRSPSSQFAETPEVAIQSYFDEDWREVEPLIANLQEELRTLEKQAVTTNESEAPDVEHKLQKAQSDLDRMIGDREVVRIEFLAVQAEKAEVLERLSLLEADLLKHRDSERIEKLGGKVLLDIDLSHCPTCRQAVGSELLPVRTSVAMGIAENMKFIKSQVQLYGASLEDIEETLVELRENYAGMTKEINEVRSRIRGLKDSLVQASGAPSQSVIERKVQLARKIEEMQLFSDEVAQHIDELQSIAKRWSVLSKELRAISRIELTNSDKNKIQELQDGIRSRISLYDFKSFKPEELVVSNETLRPLIEERDGENSVLKEVGYEVSASDFIRLKWAYYNALLAVSERHDANHLGLLVFDEPGQQQVRRESFKAFINELAESDGSSAQVIVGTSEQEDYVREILGDRDINLINFDSYILRPIERAG